MITDLLETLMILCFGLSWLISIHKSYVSRTVKGKSLFFEVFLWIGYMFGIIRKLMLWNAAGEAGLNFLFYLSGIFYFINITEITIDMLLYLRNAQLDKVLETQKDII